MNIVNSTSQQHAIPVSPTKQKSPPSLFKWKVRRIFSGKIDTLPTTVRKKLEFRDLDGDLIYRFKNQKTGRRAYGSVKLTQNNQIGHRFSTYNRRVNDEGLRKTYLENAIRHSPTAFEVAIVDQKVGISEKNLHRLEESWQDRYDTRSRRHGYNLKRPTEEPLRTGLRRTSKITVLSKVKENQRPAFLKALALINHGC